MLDHLVEDWVLLLFKLPIGNIGGGQPSWSHTNSYLWAGFWLSGLGLTPCSVLSVKGVMALSRTAFDPWVWDLV